jgi:uncharacterized protein (DUF488 family)
VTTIYTVGHGTRTLAEFVEVVRAATVDKIVDVRRFPGSRRHPHFSREALEATLPSHGIEYEMWGEVLGGRRDSAGSESRHFAWRNDSFRAYADHMDSDEFQRALDDLERAAAQAPLAVMCAERLWWNCHRRLIADALTLRGHDVVHLMDPTTRQPHKLHESVRADPAGLAVYDVGVTAELDLDP